MVEQKVKLLCSDGEEVLVDVSIAEKSVLIKGLIDDAGFEESIPIPNVKKPILDKVIEFCKQIKDNTPPEIEKPLRSTEMTSVVDAWYANYINVE